MRRPVAGMALTVVLIASSCVSEKDRSRSDAGPATASASVIELGRWDTTALGVVGGRTLVVVDGATREGDVGYVATAWVGEDSQRLRRSEKPGPPLVQVAVDATSTGAVVTGVECPGFDPNVVEDEGSAIDQCAVEAQRGVAFDVDLGTGEWRLLSDDLPVAASGLFSSGFGSHALLRNRTGDREAFFLFDYAEANVTPVAELADGRSLDSACSAGERAIVIRGQEELRESSGPPTTSTDVNPRYEARVLNGASLELVEMPSPPVALGGDGIPTACLPGHGVLFRTTSLSEFVVLHLDTGGRLAWKSVAAPRAPTDPGIVALYSYGDTLTAWSLAAEGPSLHGFLYASGGWRDLGETGDLVNPARSVLVGDQVVSQKSGERGRTRLALL